ncbi:hypothetical protein [Streptomyces sp. NPDC047000]|uniref:hypothetical protein n=1 Tax=Streptomyces sp. NPDC047000 TaxID=3155474 RepID=UPI0033CD5AAC
MIVVALLVPVVLLLFVLALDVFENLLFPPAPTAPPEDTAEQVTGRGHGNGRSPAVTRAEDHASAPLGPEARWRAPRRRPGGSGPGRGRCRHEW